MCVEKDDEYIGRTRGLISEDVFTHHALRVKLKEWWSPYRSCKVAKIVL